MSKRPNILMFLPDAMQARVVRPDHDCQTPHFDRLARRGIRFRRAYAALPTCSPSRASLMTGLLPHNHGVLQVEHCVDSDQCALRTQHPHWAQRLTEAGYRTGYFGKWHVERTNRLEAFGWQVNGCDASVAYRALGAGVAGIERLLTPGNLASYETGPEGYRPILHYGVTDAPSEQRSFALTAQMARQFLAEAMSQDRPWACCVSFSEPNTPLIASRAFFERYDIDAIRLPQNLRDDFADKPAFYRRQREIYRKIPSRQWRECRAVYYALITELDHLFGNLVDQIERAGQLEDTVVIVLSDHGRYVGAHGLDAHNFGAFEEIYNVPLIVAGPGVAQGAVTDALVSLPDLCPTILELTGARSIQVPDSRSFAPLLTDPAGQASSYNTCYAEYYGNRFLMTQRILWQGPWKFVFNGFDHDELYNLDEDPHELKNLGQDPAHEGKRREMMAGVWQRVRDTGDRALLETHYSPMRFGIVGPDAAS